MNATVSGAPTGVNAPLELVDVTRRYRDGARGNVDAVRHVSLALHPGELVVLRGASGAGKSTLLGLAAGVILPSEGEVRFEGESFSRLRESFRARVRRARMGVMLQGLALVPRMSVLENVTLAFVPDGTLGRVQIERAMAWLTRWGIASMARSRVETLSGGERQRVALVRSLVHDPDVLLFDEPTAHLDDGHVETLVHVVQEHRDRAGRVLLATHDPRWMARVSGARILEVADGALVPSPST